MTVGQLLEAMVSDSDNTAADALQHLLGGGPKITAALRALGIAGVRVDRTEKEIAADIGAHGVAAYNADPRDTATPDEMLALLRKLARGKEALRPDSHERLMKIMLASRNPHRISNGLPPGTPLAHKTGDDAGRDERRRHRRRPHRAGDLHQERKGRRGAGERNRGDRAADLRRFNALTVDRDFD